MQSALDALPPDFRAAVVLCDIEGLSYEEIAATLGIKLGTVRSRIHRGRVLLREALAHRAPRSIRERVERDPGGRGWCVVTLPDLHLAEDALAAYVDGMLSPTADDRAARHLRSCAECRDAVDAEREAKALLAATPDPELPTSLLAKLLDVPMTADIGTTDRILAMDGEELGWSFPASGANPSSGGNPHPDGRVMERRAVAPARPRGPVRPAGAARPATRSVRARRTRRGWPSRWPAWPSACWPRPHRAARPAPPPRPARATPRAPRRPGWWSAARPRWTSPGRSSSAARPAARWLRPPP